MIFKIFLDTTVLLNGFASFRTQSTIPDFLTDASAKRFTFEKCVFEAFMAFRGIGGKKPDEGRGDWAQRHLRAEFDPAPMGKLISQFHDGARDMGYFWLTQLLEASQTLESQSQFVQASEQDQWEKYVAVLQSLGEERDKFDLLCTEFYHFLQTHGITVLSYLWCFTPGQGTGLDTDPRCLDGLFKAVALPSEDFEIVYAAMRIPADIFVTEDSRLRTCSYSLGLNYPLSAANFCAGAAYKSKIDELLLLRRA